jgi:hypothetical protein
MNVLRDLSAILLAAEVFVLILVPLALFGGLVYGLAWLLQHQNLPTWLRMGREYFVTGLSYVEVAMEAVAKPVFVVHGAVSTAKAWIRGITGREVHR